ncbi:MAG: hypothetical protein ACKOXB_09645 [Flavobacteriales bacterium]
MYISDFPGLFTGILLDCIELCKTDKIFFTLTIKAENSFSIEIDTQADLRSFIEQFENKQPFPLYFPRILKIVSKDFEFFKQKTTTIQFSIDTSIITDISIDFMEFIEKTSQIALLNRQSEILIIDRRQKHHNQLFFHFPQGVFYAFDRAAKKSWGQVEIKLHFDEKIEENHYQIGLAYSTDWCPNPNIITFANDVHTICGGSLSDGIVEGVYSAFKTYSKKNKLKAMKITRKKILNGLIVVATVRGKKFEYGGSFKERLENEIVKKQAANIIHNLLLNFLMQEKEITTKFFNRFDKNNIGSIMF